MHFEWDEDKRRAVFEERGVDLLDAALIFEGPVVTKVDARRDYGEKRYLSIGEADGVIYAVVHTRRREAIRLITAWTVGRRDRERYKASLAERPSRDEGQAGD